MKLSTVLLCIAACVLLTSTVSAHEGRGLGHGRKLQSLLEDSLKQITGCAWHALQTLQHM